MSLDLLKDAFSGAVGSVFLVYAGIPFETVKIRLQTGATGGPFRVLGDIVRTEGPMACWKGAMAGLMSAMTENVVLFAANGAIQRAVATVRGEDAPPPSLLLEAAMGSASGFFSSTAICSAEVIQCRMQVDTASTLTRGGSGASGSGGTRPLSPLQTARILYEAEGVRGFFRGLPALWARDVPFYFPFFGAYAWYMHAASEWTMTEKEALNPVHYAIGGALAGAAGWGTIYPFDVVKSRMQVGIGSASSAGVFATLQTIVAKEGAQALFRGYGAAVVRSLPANGSLFLGVELCNSSYRALGI